MKLFFAGCARDCGDVVAANISALLVLGESSGFDETKVFVAENSSTDNTRGIIIRLASEDERVIPVLLEDLDQHISRRESRIAFCRDRLLREIFIYSTDGLYIPIDLDSNIASSLEPHQFMDACKLVASGKASGVFPSSFPYYYDIYALRALDWCPLNAWKKVLDTQSPESLWTLLVYIRYVSSRQKPHSELQAQGLIPVESAFGGLGIYCLAKVFHLGAHYSSSDLEDDHLMLCEHVVFNGFLDRLFINPCLVIQAPPGHIEFRLLPRFLKVWKVIKTCLRDARRLALHFHVESSLSLPLQRY